MKNKITNKITNGATNHQQTNNKQITTNNNDKNDNNINIKKEQEEKKHFADFVTMTNAEHKKLIDTYGTDFANQCIEILDNYKGSKGKEYKSDYRAILSWVVDENKKRQAEKSKHNSDKKAYSNYSQRNYKSLNNLYANMKDNNAT